MTSPINNLSITDEDENENEIRSLPEYAQNILPEIEDSELPILILISHSHAPPLTPPPGLKFDVRGLPNPPKNVRDSYDGRAKRLQEWLEGDERFEERRGEIRGVIEGEMETVLERWERRDVLRWSSGEARDDGKSKQEAEEEESVAAGSDDAGDELSSEGADDDSISSSPDVPELQVGIFCAMGRHRSVAMVETLAKMPWPGWRVKVEHRDVAKKRGLKSGARDKKSRGNRGGSAAFDIDGSE